MDEIDHLLRVDGAVSWRRHRHLRGALERRHRQGLLKRVLPCTYVSADVADQVKARAAAVRQWDPTAVVIGRAAARLTYWPDLPVTDIEVAVSGQPARPGYRFVRSGVPPDHVASGVATPLWAALDLVPRMGARPLHKLRTHEFVAPEEIAAVIAEMAGRRGQQARKDALARNAWSAAEEAAHDALREAGITGWLANAPTPVGGTILYPDLRFDREGVMVEVQGFVHHGDRDAYDKDLARRNAFTAAGWTVLEVSGRQINRDRARFVGDLSAVLARSRASSHTRLANPALKRRFS